MAIEIREGHGCGENGDHMKLKLDHLGEEVLNSHLRGILLPQQPTQTLSGRAELGNLGHR